MGFYDRLYTQLYLCEDLEGKLGRLIEVLLSKKSNWRLKSQPNSEALAREFIIEISEFDPTSNKKYLPFIVGQVSRGRINLPEDGPQMRHLLEFFSSNKWDSKKQDIFQYKDWRLLQKEINEIESSIDAGKSFGMTISQYEKQSRKGGEEIYSMTSTDKEYRIVRITTPEAAAVYGRGAQWCTTASLFTTTTEKQTPEAWFIDKHESSRGKPEWKKTPFEKFEKDDFLKIISDMNKDKDLKRGDQLKVPNTYYGSAIATAENYMKNDPLYIIYKEGKPYMQLDSSDQIMNENDIALKKLGGATARFIAYTVLHGSVTEQEKVYFEKIITSYYKPKKSS